jgi:hypothetical protein
MKAAVIGALIGAGLTAVAFGEPVGAPRAAAQQASPYEVGASHDLIALSAPGADNHLLLTIVDAKAKVVSVYQVDRANGEIALKSVRDINWDLRMMEFNGVKPLPHEIRSLVEQR